MFIFRDILIKDEHSRKDTAMSQSIEDLISEETEKRLKEMGDTSYVFPPKASKADYIGIALCVLICLILIILCMTGGIK